MLIHYIAAIPVHGLFVQVKGADSKAIVFKVFIYIFGGFMPSPAAVALWLFDAGSLQRCWGLPFVSTRFESQLIAGFSHMR